MRLILCAVALIALASMSCSSSKPAEETFIVTLQAMDAQAAETRTTFARGETIRFRLTIRWTGRSDTMVHYSADSGRGVIVTTTSGESVWRYPAGGAAVIVSETWQPGQQRTFDFTWENQTQGESGTPAAHGRYRVETVPLQLPKMKGYQPVDFDIAGGDG